jgi:hypothetical protein
MRALSKHCLCMHVNYKVETGLEQKAAFPKRVIFFPQKGQGDRSGNCPAGLVVDSGRSSNRLYTG